MDPRSRHSRSPRGFSLLELLLASLLGLLLWGVAVRLLMAEGEQGARLGRLARERLWQRRSLDLIRLDLRRAERLELEGSGTGAACSMTGRRPVLHLARSGGLRRHLQRRRHQLVLHHRHLGGRRRQQPHLPVVRCGGDGQR